MNGSAAFIDTGQPSAAEIDWKGTSPGAGHRER
jgi:hypothetical protein